MSNYDLHTDWYQRCQELIAALEERDKAIAELSAKLKELQPEPVTLKVDKLEIKNR